MRRARGFTLLEVLVAFAIAAIGLISLYRMASVGLGSVSIAAGTIEATRRAQSRLAMVGVIEPLTPGERHGEDDDGMSWSVVVTPTASHPTAAGKAQPSLDLYAVEVTIKWPSNGTQRSVNLTDYRLVSHPAPKS